MDKKLNSGKRLGDNYNSNFKPHQQCIEARTKATIMVNLIRRRVEYKSMELISEVRCIMHTVC